VHVRIGGVGEDFFLEQQERIDETGTVVANKRERMMDAAFNDPAARVSICASGRLSLFFYANDAVIGEHSHSSQGPRAPVQEARAGTSVCVCALSVLLCLAFGAMCWRSPWIRSIRLRCVS
jgi:hypothetical protein